MARDGVVECVPNFSEGRDEHVIDSIVSAAVGVEGAKVIGSEPDPDYNRTVVTIAGEPEGVSEAAFRLISRAASVIDMSEHSGEHPRMGAVDVCPFVPITGASMVDCVSLARNLSDRVANELSLPVYLYGEAATKEERRSLAALRKGQYEGLESRFDGSDDIHSDATRLPDAGPIEWNEKTSAFGAIAIGARRVLVAYNVNLDEADARVARICGSIVRTSGRLIKGEDGRKMRTGGMLDGVQGMGVPLETHGISQVSMNLQDVTKTDMHEAFECIRSIAADHGIETAGSELVGLAPLSSFIAAGRWFHANPSIASEDDLVQAAIIGLGLDRLSSFDPMERIIEWAAVS